MLPAAHLSVPLVRRARTVRHSPRLSVPALLLLYLCASWAGPLGCTNANRPLNGVSVPLENRSRNHTRAATFAEVISPAQQMGLRVPGPSRAPSPSPPSQTRPTDPSTPGADSSAPASAPASLIRPTTQAPQRAAADVDPLPADNDGCFVGLALSGGGSRSANFSAACMFQLERLGLLRRVDYISAVSGGSLPAAYYCASGPEWNPGDVQNKLTHSFAGDLIGQSLLPWNWFALAFTDYDRSDILAAIFQRELFTRHDRPLTYGDLRPDRPRLLINATDLQSGRRFVFCDETINSDLSKYPLAYAVAASSAVPIVMHPVTLRDYSTRFAQYRHLIDGGIADNLGVETLVETFSAHVESARAAGRPDPYPKGAVLIVVDAHTQYDAALSSRSDIGPIESLKAAAGLSTTSLLNRASSATLADLIVRRSQGATTADDLRADIDRLSKEGYLTLTDKTDHKIRVVYLALSQIGNLSATPFASFGESVNSIGTYFDIRDVDAYYLYQAADLLVRQRFQAPLGELARELEEP